MENYGWKQLHYPPTIQKTTNQTVHVPRLVKNGNTLPNLSPIELPQRQYYPSCRPLKHYRKTGTTHSNNANSPYYTTPNCDQCNSTRVGTPFKTLGKKDDGYLKNEACSTGDIISFSGIANVRKGLLNKTKDTLGEILPGYYHNYSAYLKKRGHTYAAKSTLHPIPEVDYTKSPSNTHNDSSQYYTTNIVECPTKKLRAANYFGTTIYKPNNPTFARQGPVDGGSYVARRKYNTIISNNASLGRVPYSENPVFTMKHKFYTCKMTC